MYWSILHRTIFLELARVFLLSLVGLTGVLLMGGIVAEASQRGLGPTQLLAAIPLLIPSTLPYTLPATTLFATCVVYGRLAHDNEILAVKAAGIHLGHVIWPALLLGIGVSGITIGLYMDVIPSTHHELRTRFIRDVEEFLYSMLERENCIRHQKMPYTIYVKGVQGKKLLDAQFMRRDAKNQGFDIIARAREAELRVDMNRKLVLVHMRHCYISSDNGADEAYVEEKTWPVELPEEITSTAKNGNRSRTWGELFEYAEKVEADRQRLIDDIAARQAKSNAGSVPEHGSRQLTGLLAQKREHDSILRHVATEIQMRPALALGCLCFVLVGCPVGIWFSRSDYLSAFITCFLPIVVLYYPLLLCGINLSKGGRIAPALGLWAANTLMAVIALGLFRKLLRN